MRVTNLHSGLTLFGTALSPAAGPRGYDCNSVALPTVAVRGGPFSSYPHDDRGQRHRYDTIDSHLFTVAQNYAICSITMHARVQGVKQSVLSICLSVCLSVSTKITRSGDLGIIVKCKYHYSVGKVGNLPSFAF